MHHFAFCLCACSLALSKLCTVFIFTKSFESTTFSKYLLRTRTFSYIITVQIMCWDSTVIQNAAYISNFPNYPSNIHSGVFIFSRSQPKITNCVYCQISLVSFNLTQCTALCVFLDVFFFFNNSGHVFCRISFNLDLSDCFLMISFSLNILAKNMCAFQCVPSRVPDVSMSQFFEVRFDHLIIPFIQLCLLDPSCSFPRVDHSYSFFYV